MWHAWERNVYRVLMGKPEGKRPLGRPRRRWEDGIRMDLREIGWGSLDWMQLAQHRVLAPRSKLVRYLYVPPAVTISNSKFCVYG
jgi:hypothetical protein